MLFRKIFTSCFLLLAHLPLKVSGSQLVFNGNYTMNSELYQNVEINFFLYLGNYNANVYLRTYENEKLIYNQIHKVRDLEYCTLYFPGFDKYKQTKDIKIEVEYVSLSGNIASSSFTIYGPTNNIVNMSSNRKIYESAPVITMFNSDGSYANQQEVFSYDIDFSSIILKKSRYITFESFYFQFYSPTELPKFNVLEVDFEIYGYFENSDLDYNSNGDGYTKISFTATKNEYGYYFIDNDYRFYVDKYMGTIYENYNSNCSEQLHPFFIPFTIPKNSNLYCIITIKNVGICKNEFCFYINLSIESDLFGNSETSTFYYEEIGNLFFDIEYEV